MTKTAILAPGLIGGSIALALRAQKAGRIAVWARRDEAVEKTLAGGFADEASTDARAIVADADVVIFCTPIGAMPALATEIAPVVKADALITDVGSVKAPVVAALAPIFAGRARFIGSHPMAGSEQSGIDAARADLFTGTACIITPDDSTDATAIDAATALWRSLGCTVRRLPPAQHDETVALISHFPHLLAATLVNAVASRNAAAFDFAGPGFRDCTRVAGGPPAMWTEILGANREAIFTTVELMIEKLGEIRKLLALDTPARDLQLHELLALAKQHRDRLRLK